MQSARGALQTVQYHKQLHLHIVVKTGGIVCGYAEDLAADCSSQVGFNAWVSIGSVFQLVALRVFEG